MMKLLDAIQQITLENIKLLDDIEMTLEERLDWLSDREPESSGMVYDAWSEKLDDLQEILDSIGELKEEDDKKRREELAAEIKESIQVYQLMHGGLSRLKVC